MTRLYRKFGPPGTGKTSWLGRCITEAVGKWGPESVLVTSLTKAAAAEIVGRGLPVGHRQIGTLHSHCWHALNGPAIFEATPDAVAAWNRDYPQYPMSCEKNLKADNLDPDALAAKEGGKGDYFRAATGILRARRLPIDSWPSVPQREFYEKFRQWKLVNQVMDFTDTLETVIADGVPPTFSPRVIYADEAQDLSRLSLAVLQSWAARCDGMVMVGDADQAIYEFAGADGEAFLELPADQEDVLDQSYRVPVAVHAEARNWIQRNPLRKRDALYKPRAGSPGACERSALNFGRNHAPRLVGEAAERAAGGASVMLLATCDYMLGPVVSELRRQGIPFHNPYRRKNAAWNPLNPPKGVPTIERVAAFLRPCALWSWGDVQSWATLLPASVFNHGSKTAIDKEPQEDPADIGKLCVAYLKREHVEAATGGNLDWLAANAATKSERSVEYAVAVLKRDKAAVGKRPGIIVGTAHSVKGGEADVVYLSPELSPSANRAWMTTEGKAAIYRTFYVGMTRARESLYLCGSASPNRVGW